MDVAPCSAMLCRVFWYRIWSSIGWRKTNGCYNNWYWISLFFIIMTLCKHRVRWARIWAVMSFEELDTQMLDYFMIWEMDKTQTISCHVPSSSQLNKIISKYLIWRIGCKYVTNEFHEEKPKLDNCRINKFDKIYLSAKNVFFENLSF